MDNRQLKQVRKALGFNQTEFSKEVFGVARATYARWENGKAAIPPGTETRIREYLKSYGVKLQKEKSSDKTTKILGASTAAALIGFRLFGPLGAAALGVAAGTFASQNQTDDNDIDLNTTCPWCQRTVFVSSVDEISEYVCKHCNKEFRFKRKKGKTEGGAIRITG